MTLDLTTDELEALRQAHDHIRAHMEREHPGATRDLAMITLGRFTTARSHDVIDLTSDELEALRQAHDHIRVHMAHRHPWAVRDLAMTTISRLINAHNRGTASRS